MIPKSGGFGILDASSSMANLIIGIAQDFGEAYRLLGAALDCFELHLEGDKTDIKALGNCGNTLLALGELKVWMEIAGFPNDLYEILSL